MLLPPGAENPSYAKFNELSTYSKKHCKELKATTYAENLYSPTRFSCCSKQPFFVILPLRKPPTTGLNLLPS